MQTIIKERVIKKHLVLLLSTLILLTIFLPTTVFANTNIWRGGTVIQYETTSAPFSTGSDNKLTVVAVGTVERGNPGFVTVKLQKNVLGIYVTERTMTVPTNGISTTILRDYPVSTNTNYRLVYSCGGSYGIDVAYISMGVSIWS
ncbi:MAG: hypothetical protein PHE29_11680 [Tissierellia bacterium]|nr:hypothetical protein [Tissierellia bacterium]